MADQVRSTLRDLRAARLPNATWASMAGELARLAAGVERGDQVLVGRALIPLSRVAYEGKVRSRLAGADRRAAVVVGTKPTSSLPWVGGACGLLVMAMGYALGGVPMLIVTALFALFILGVAVAGTRTNAERTEDRRARRVSPTRESLEPPPAAVVEAVRAIERDLGFPPAAG
ncbi:MAG TPA: hypothetical protein VJ804_02320 [Acidimicrobiales bacterium]|nr:hypothetical protein [Acidimicrobiales bacterium]